MLVTITEHRSCVKVRRPGLPTLIVLIVSLFHSPSSLSWFQFMLAIRLCLHLLPVYPPVYLSIILPYLPLSLLSENVMLSCFKYFKSWDRLYYPEQNGYILLCFGAAIPSLRSKNLSILVKATSQSLHVCQLSPVETG